MHIVPNTVANAYEKAGKALYTAEGRGKDINLSSILTFLIQQTGRFVEQFASDLFIDWKSVEQFIADPASRGPLNDTIFVFGLRDSGVDGASFLMSRLEDTREGNYACPSHTYRKVYALRVSIRDGYIKAELRDIMSSLYRMADEELDTNEANKPYQLLNVGGDGCITSYTVAVSRSWLEENLAEEELDLPNISEEAARKAYRDGAIAATYHSGSRKLYVLEHDTTDIEDMQKNMWRVDACITLLWKNRLGLEAIHRYYEEV